MAKPKEIIDLKGITPPSGFTKDPLGLIDMYLQNRGNNLRKEDIDDLSRAIIYMPALQKLDLGDNPIGDDGIRLALVTPLNLMPFQNVGIVFELSFSFFCRCLIPLLIKASEGGSPLDELNLGNCDLSSCGVVEFLKNLISSKVPLKALCISDNSLGRYVPFSS